MIVVASAAPVSRCSKQAGAAGLLLPLAAEAKAASVRGTTAAAGTAQAEIAALPVAHCPSLRTFAAASAVADASVLVVVAVDVALLAQTPEPLLLLHLHTAAACEVFREGETSAQALAADLKRRGPPGVADVAKARVAPGAAKYQGPRERLWGPEKRRLVAATN